MLSIAQQAAKTAGIDRILQIAGNLAGIDPAIMDKIDVDYAIDRYSYLMNNDPKLIRSDKAVAQIRAQRQQEQQQAQQAQQMEQAGGAAQAAKTLSETQVGGGQNALNLAMGRVA
jgi:regulator of protease activity HflC (stomatin/prohibitin superfamily)